jgi:hypothetical protein
MTNLEYKYLNDEKKYKIYNNGNIFSIKTNKFLKSSYSKNHNNYNISLVIDNKNKKFVIHTLIYKLFIGEIKKGHYITFIDDDSSNSNIDNLIEISRRNNKKKILFDENIWKFIPEYEDRYIINRKGIVKSLIIDKILEDTYNTQFEQAYKSVKLIDKEGNRNSFLIHTLVYKTFVGDIPKNMVIDHIDRDKFNNNLENLRLLTQSENSKNCIRTDIQKNDLDILSSNFINIGKKYNNFDLSNYTINEYGQIKTKTNKLMKLSNQRNYKIISLIDKLNNKRHNIRINQLVATIFLENPNNYKIVHHKDNNRENNQISNLEWTDHKQNITYSQGKKIAQYSLNDEFIKEFDSVNDAFRELGKQYGANIRWVCDGKRQTAFGFKWKWV